jgi:N-acetylglucosaminyldiphosphoundecaprenol N-acetyl-beta-D-mannosaminyltransferase
MFEKLNIISLGLHHLSFTESLDCVTGLAMERKSAYVCFANVHMIIEAFRDKDFQAQVNKADLVLADGKPLVFGCRLLYHKKQERISGMDFIPRILERASEKKLSVFIYGSTDEVIKFSKKRIETVCPGIHLSGAISPPFRQLTEEELKKDIELINQSGAQLVLVALGCPSQEKWMAENSGKINGTLLGIGGALPVFAGLQKRAPRWMQILALEWFYRLMQQPARLFSRYFYTNIYFLFLFTGEWVKRQFFK